MEKNKFLKVLNKIDAKIKLMSARTAETRLLFELGNMAEAYEHALRLETITEQTILLTRALPAYSGNPRAESEVESLIRQSVPVTIGFTEENWFALRFPALLPKKTEGSADYIRSFLYPAMKEYFSRRQPVRYENSVLIYRHVYDTERPERRKRDHDNIEINMVSDIVTMYVMPDDGPKFCSHFYCSAEGSEDRTEVYVVPRGDFRMWLLKEPIMPKKGLKLGENRAQISRIDM